MRLYFLIILICSTRVVAQPAIEWQHCYGGSSNDYCYGSCKTFDGGLIAVGITYSNDGDIAGTLSGSGDAWVVRCDNAGTPLWKQRIGGSGLEWASSVLQTNDSGFIIVGFTTSFDSGIIGNHGGGGDGYVIKLDKNGNITWQKALGGTGYDNFNSIIPDATGGYVVAGNTTSSDGEVTGFHTGGSVSDFDMWIVKLDDTGAIVWQHAFGGSGSDDAFGVSQTADSGFIVTGYTTSNDGDVSGYHLPCCNYDIWVLKLNQLGTLQWQKCFGGTSDDYGFSVLPAWNRGYVIAGATSSHDGDISYYHGGDIHGGDMWLLKIDDTGRKEWEKTYGGSNNERARSMLRTPGGYVMAGWTESTDGDVTDVHANADYWVVKVNDTGRIVWQKCYGGADDDRGMSIAPSDDNGFFVSGYTTSVTVNGDVTFNNGLNDMWLVKLGAPANVPLINQGAGATVFPNPVSGMITVQLPSAVDMTVSISDPLGKEYIRERTVNTNILSLQMNELPTGIYFVTVMTEKGSAVYKVVKED